MLLYSQKIEDELRGKLIFRWIVNNEAERLAIVPTENERNMLCLQKDTFKIYGLESINPIKWASPFPNGLSAYEVAVKNGFTGTESEWLASLSAYGVAVKQGFTGTLNDWLLSLKGDKGDPFKISKTYKTKAALEADKNPGLAVGEMAVVATDNENDKDNGRLYSWNGTAFQFILDMSGIQGIKGLSAYEVAAEDGFTGTKTEWLSSLVGPQGSFGGAIANYSETEERLPQVWSDGRPLYRKVVDFGSLPVAEEASKPHNISNFDFAVGLYGVAISESEGKTFPLPRVYTNSVSNIALYIDATNVYIRTADNFRSFSGIIVIEYTKKNDRKLSEDEIHKLQYAWLDGIPLTTVIPAGNMTDIEAERYGFIKLQHNKKHLLSKYDELYQLIKDWDCVKTDEDMFWFDLTQNTSDITNLNILLGKNSSTELLSGGDEQRLSLFAWMKAKKTVMSFLPLNYSDAVEFLQSVKLDSDGIPEWNGQSWRGGKQGLSAYEVAVENGFTGTESEWLATFGGIPGYSAYQVAVENGFTGTEAQWLESLKGKSAYEIAVLLGFTGTEVQWLESLKGSDGKSAYQVAVDNGFVGTEQDFLNFIKGPQGIPGPDGKSAYQVAVDNGFVGTEQEWLHQFSNAAQWGMISGSLSAQADIIDKFDEQQKIIDRKVDIVEGKQLSTNDYTDADKNLVKSIDTKIDTIIPGPNIIVEQFGAKVVVSGMPQDVEWGMISGSLSAQADLSRELKNINNRFDSKVDKVSGKDLSTNDYTNEDKALVERVPEKLETKNIKQGKNIKIDVDGNNVTITGPDVLPSSWGSITGSISDQKDLDSLLMMKVDKVSGKSLSTNDYTNEDKKLVSSISDKLEPMNIKAGENIDIEINGNDVTISGPDQVETKWGMISGSLSAQSDIVDKFENIQLSIDRKVDAINGKQLSTNDYTNEDKALVGTISQKVDKVSGKDLSTNDYTDVDKALVSTIANKLEKSNIKAGENVSITADGNDLIVSAIDQDTEWGMISGALSAQGDLAYEFRDVRNKISQKVDKISGKELSTNDYTNRDKNLVNSIPNKLEVGNIKQGKNINVKIDNGSVIISGNDQVEPEWGMITGSLSAQTDLLEKFEKVQFSIDRKVSKVSGKGLSTNDYTNTDKSLVGTITDKLEAKNIKQGKNIEVHKVGNEITISGPDVLPSSWGSITGSISDQKDLNDALGSKVNVVEGKQLSTNDYTDADRALVGTINQKIENIVQGKNIEIKRNGNTVTVSAADIYGKSAYDIAVDNGFIGSVEDWLLSLKGNTGDKGEQGDPFKISKTFGSIAELDGTGLEDGSLVMIASSEDDPDNAKVFVYSDGQFKFLVDLSGLPGIKGSDGKSAYQVAVENGFTGTEAQWLESLKNNAYWGQIQGNITNQKDISDILDSKVDKVSGKDLSTNDYTDADKALVERVPEKLEVKDLIQGENVLLEFNENGSVVISSSTEWGTLTGSLSAQDDLVEIINNIKLSIERKADAVDGKQLSTNDYTNEDKKLVNSISDKLEAKNIKAGENIDIEINGNDVIISTWTPETSGSNAEINELKKQIAELKATVAELENRVSLVF